MFHELSKKLNKLNLNILMNSFYTMLLSCYKKCVENDGNYGNDVNYGIDGNYGDDENEHKDYEDDANS